MLRRFAKEMCLKFDAPPIQRLLAAYYRLGLQQLLRTLKAMPEVTAVYGCGSYFEGSCVYGQSDIDLIIVVDERYSRLDGTHSRLARRYRRLALLFPMLGSWAEQEESVLYQGEFASGEALPASFVVRAQRKQLFHLLGTTQIEQFLPDTHSSLAVLEELSSLVRLPLVRCESHTRVKAFWKSLFRKVQSARASFGLPHREYPQVDREDVDPSEMFALLIEELLSFESELCLAPAVTAVFCSFNRLKDGGPRNSSIRQVLTKAQLTEQTRWLSEPLLFSVEPSLLFFDLSESIPFVSLPATGFSDMRRLITELRESGEHRDAVVLEIGGLLVLLHREHLGTSVVPLHPLQYPLPYCRVRGKIGYSIPQTIATELAIRAKNGVAHTSSLYRRNVDWIEKHDFPCTYIEDEYLSIRDALSIWRGLLFGQERIDFDSVSRLIERLSERHPEARDFLVAIESYYFQLSNGSIESRPANNIYRCLHEFTWQLLAGAQSISLSPVDTALGITVGIITRNRAGVLREALDSLTAQQRKADEVLIVDNGSKDNTKEVIESFIDSLPIRYFYLEEPSIPRARNYVIEHASQDVISFTDDDCLTHPNWLASVERAFLRAENVGVVGGWVYHHPSEKPSALDSYYQMFHHRKP